MRTIDFFTPLNVILSILSLFIIIPIYGIYREIIDLEYLRYLSYSIPIVSIYFIFAILTLITTNKYMKRKYGSLPSTIKNINIDKSKFLIISIFTFAISLFIQITLIYLSGFDIVYVLNNSLEYRFAISKNANGIQFLLFYTPLNLIVIIYSYYRFYSLYTKFSFLQKFLYRIVFLTGIGYAVLSGSRMNLIMLILIMLYASNAKKRINVIQLSVFTVFLIGIVGFLGAFRFGINATSAIKMIESMTVLRFDAIIPNSLDFIDYYLAGNEQVWFGFFYFALPLVFIPRAILGDAKPETFEAFANRTMSVADNTGKNFGAVSEFMINFGFPGIIFQLFVIMLIFILVYSLYVKSLSYPNSFTLYIYMFFFPFSVVLNGIAFYGIIKIPFMFCLVYIFNKSMKLTFRPQKNTSLKTDNDKVQ